VPYQLSYAPVKQQRKAGELNPQTPCRITCFPNRPDEPVFGYPPGTPRKHAEATYIGGYNTVRQVGVEPTRALQPTRPST
jgi:hypothetical protein